MLSQSLLRALKEEIAKHTELLIGGHLGGDPQGFALTVQYERGYIHALKVVEQTLKDIEADDMAGQETPLDTRS